MRKLSQSLGGYFLACAAFFFTLEFMILALYALTDLIYGIIRFVTNYGYSLREAIQMGFERDYWWGAVRRYQTTCPFSLSYTLLIVALMGMKQLRRRFYLSLATAVTCAGLILMIVVAKRELPRLVDEGGTLWWDVLHITYYLGAVAMATWVFHRLMKRLER